MKQYLDQFRKLSIAARLSLFVAALLFLTIGITVNNALNKQEKRTHAANTATASTCTLFVAQNGNDNNPGTEALPFLTIQKAANAAVGGNTVCVKAGTYTEHVIFPNSGSSGNYITFQNFQTDTVTIKPPAKTYLSWNQASPNHHSGNFEMTGKAYIKIKGLKFVGNGGSAVPDAVISVEQGANNIIIDGDSMDDIWTSAVIAGYFKPSGQSYAAWDIIFTNNYIRRPNGDWVELMSYDSVNRPIISYNNFAYQAYGECLDYKSGTDNGIISYNRVDNCWNLRMGPGGSRVKWGAIYIDAYDEGVNNNKVFNNIVSNAGGVTVGSEQGALAQNNIFYNNIIFDSTLGFGTGYCCAPYTPNEQNNIFINNVTYNIESMAYFAEKGTNNIFRNNIAYGSGGTNNIVSQNIQDKNSWNLGITDPQFVNAAGHDFHLKSTSPAINAGSPVDAPSTDFSGAARPVGSAFDIGAYEYGALPIPPTPFPSVNYTPPLSPLIPTTNPTPRYVTPTIYCLGSCPTSIPTPTSNPSQTQPTGIVPTIPVSQTPSTSPAPTVIPCSTLTPNQINNAAANKRGIQARRGGGGLSGILQQLLQLLIQLINQLLQLLGLGGIPTQPTQPATPTPSIQPTQSVNPQPGSPAPTLPPCEPSPTFNPEPTNSTSSAIIQGTVSTDTSYFQILIVGGMDEKNKSFTININNPEIGKQYPFSFNNLNPNETYKVSLFPNHNENKMGYSDTDPVKITQCSGTIQKLGPSSPNYCVIKGSGTADFFVNKEVCLNNPCLNPYESPSCQFTPPPAGWCQAANPTNAITNTPTPNQPTGNPTPPLSQTSTSPAPTNNPCNSISSAQSSAQASRPKPKKAKGIFEKLLEFITKLIEELLKLIGIGISPTPSTQPTPTSSPAPSVQPTSMPSTQPGESATPQPGTPTPTVQPCIPSPTPSPIVSTIPNPNQKYKINVGITTFGEPAGYDTNNFTSEFRDFVNANSKFDLTLIGNNKYPPLYDDEIPLKPFSNCADGAYWPDSNTFHADTKTKFPLNVSINMMAFDSKNKPMCFTGTFQSPSSINGTGLISLAYGVWPVDVDNGPSCVNGVCTWKRAFTQVFVHEWIHSLDYTFNSLGYPDFPSADDCGKYGYNGNDDPGWQKCYTQFLSSITDPMYTALNNISTNTAQSIIPYKEKHFESDPLNMIHK